MKNTDLLSQQHSDLSSSAMEVRIKLSELHGLLETHLRIDREEKDLYPLL